MTEHPERVAAEPTIPARILTAAASAAVAALAKKLLERGLVALMEAGSGDRATTRASRGPRLRDNGRPVGALVKSRR
jgi:hypothetical protein